MGSNPSAGSDMFKFSIIFGILLAFAGVYFLWNFPVFITDKGAKEQLEKQEVIELSGKTLFISDFHLKKWHVGGSFDLDVSGVKQVMIVGDFFDSKGDFRAYGVTDAERIERGLRTFLPADFTGDGYFVWGYGHDPVLPESEYSLRKLQFYYLGEFGKFDIDGVSVVMLHGQHLHRGFLGGGFSWLVQKLNYPLLLERVGRNRFELDEDTWLIAAHSHVPALHAESKTANTGSFAGVPFNSFFKIPVGTGIIVEDGEVRLVKF